MTFYFCGYFPKKATRPDGYELPGVVDIASVSNCIAEGPEDWIESWAFNELGFFDDVDVAESLVPESDRAEYHLGFDVVSKSVADFFECSPLACNHAAKTFRANAHCLFDALDDAVAAAKVFSKGNWEPGPYYVARVLRRRRAGRGEGSAVSRLAC